MVGAVGLIILAPSLTNVREEVRFIRATHDSLDRDCSTIPRSGPGCAAARSRSRPIASCPTRAGTSRAPRSASRSALRRARGIEVFALGQKALRRYGFAAGTSPRVNLPSPGYAPVARHGLLAAYRRC